MCKTHQSNSEQVYEVQKKNQYTLKGKRADITHMEGVRI